MSEANPRSLLFSGGKVGDIVEGLEPVNKGLLLKLKQDQEKGFSGRIVGRFELLSEGTGEYAEYLKEVVGQSFSAGTLIEEILERLNKQSTRQVKNLHIFNCNLVGLKS